MIGSGWPRYIFSLHSRGNPCDRHKLLFADSQSIQKVMHACYIHISCNYLSLNHSVLSTIKIFIVYLKYLFTIVLLRSYRIIILNCFPLLSITSFQVPGHHDGLGPAIANEHDVHHPYPLVVGIAVHRLDWCWKEILIHKPCRISPLWNVSGNVSNNFHIALLRGKNRHLWYDHSHL